MSSSAARTISLELRAAPAWSTAVWPSRDTEAPGRGGTTDFTERLSARTRVLSSTAARNAGLANV